MARLLDNPGAQSRASPPASLGNCAFCLVFFVAVPLAIYYASYYHYGTARGLAGGVGMYFTRDYFDIVWDNQAYMWEYHSDLVSTHPYSSRWYQWLADARPILYYLEYFPDGTTKMRLRRLPEPRSSAGPGCWPYFANAVLAVKDRDGKAAFIVIGYLAQLLPWVLVTRLTFAYHYFPSEVFLLLALCHVWARLREQAAAPLAAEHVRPHRRKRGAVRGLLPRADRPAHCALWYTRGLPALVPELAVLTRCDRYLAGASRADTAQILAYHVCL